ncbi:TolC family protein [Spirosoma foliorum]|uniref:TolC family protein n=1 Tax=Spirosoma foliorum TaxID=2710596 RepID=A0A7G5H3Z9_9BACT|nr:TolC family protein [Spirosoma foliorum]QMW05841.1 TolC family protein [Spirosoma foliorum]
MHFHHLVSKLMSIGCLLLVLHTHVKAQTTPVPTSNLSSAISRWTIPPLDTVLKLARNHSSSVKLQEAMTERGSYYIKNQKQFWLDGVGVDLQLGLGNQALLIQQANGSLESFQNFNNGYRANLNVRLSLYNILGRKNLVKMAESEYEAARQRVGYAIQDVETIVITKYYAAQAAWAMLHIKEESKQVNRLSRQMAEKDFSKGNISVTELARIVQISTFADSEYETAKQAFYENIRILEVLTGYELFPGN